MKRKTQLFWAAFTLTAILILTLCGFALVDLSSDRYIPGQFTRLLELDSLDSTGLRFAAAGKAWEITPATIAALLEPLERWSGLLPAGAFWGKTLAEWLLGFGM